jgi:hypothetical protein
MDVDTAHRQTSWKIFAETLVFDISHDTEEHNGLAKRAGSLLVIRASHEETRRTAKVIVSGADLNSGIGPQPDTDKSAAMEDSVRDCIEGPTESSTHASNKFSSLCSQAISQARGQAGMKSFDRTPGWVRF